MNRLASFIIRYPVKERRGAFKWVGEGKVEENGLLEENADGKCKPMRKMRHGLAVSRGVVR